MPSVGKIISSRTLAVHRGMQMDRQGRVSWSASAFISLAIALVPFVAHAQGAAVAPASAPAPATPSEPGLTECQQAADALVALIKKESIPKKDKKGNVLKDKDGNDRKEDVQQGPFSLVYFCGKSGGHHLTSSGREFIAVGDTIYYAYYGADSGRNVYVDPVSCGQRSATPVELPQTANAVRGMGTTATSPRWVPENPLKAECFAKEPEFKLTDSSGTVISTYKLSQYERYTFTAQVGVAFTSRVEHNYAVTEGKIRDAGPSSSGPDYFASVVVYAFPKYFTSLFDHRPYFGRDVVNENGWLDRTGLLLGIGLDTPRKNFLTGISFELLNGINVIGAHRWARYQKLDGVAAGDTIAAGVDIPKHEVWDKSWVVGLSLDTRYVARIITNK